MDKFPRIAELGIAVHDHSAGGFSYVARDDLAAALGDRWEDFCEHFGTQTCPIGGLFAWDVEAVLERMVTGKLTGSQLDWD